VLENGGFVVTRALNGAETMAAVQESMYDVILMDIQMPLMNGVVAT
jgi:CheY-like chemotaxis protein